MTDRPTLGAVEERTTLDQAATVDGRRLRGLIPYGVESRDMGGWREIIDAGALADADLSDLIATREHDRSKLLGRHPTTLTVEDRADGFAWAVELPQSPVGEDARVAVERGDLRSTSWRMVVARERWDGDVRHVEAISELRDVTVTASPAYGDAAPVEYRSTDSSTGWASTPTSTSPQEENPVNTEDRTEGGGLAVEDRTATPADTTPVEARIRDALLSVPKGENRALTTASTLAPGELSNFLFDKLRARSVALASGITVVSTERDTVTYPRLTADVAPGWYAEAATITAGDPTLDSIVATPRKLAHRVEFSNEVIDDSDPSAVDVVRDNVIAALGLKLDLGIFAGSGTAPEIRGLRNVVGANEISKGVNGGTLALLDDFADAIKLLDDANATAGAIVLAPRTWNVIRKLKDTQNRYLVNAGTTDTPPSIFGVPVFVSSQISITETQGTATNATSVYIYQPDQLVLVRRSDVEVELDRSRLFNSDQSELRGKLRADLIVPNPTAVTRIIGIIP